MPEVSMLFDDMQGVTVVESLFTQKNQDHNTAFILD
jgi:hypothetical protein